MIYFLHDSVCMYTLCYRSIFSMCRPQFTGLQMTAIHLTLASQEFTQVQPKPKCGQNCNCIQKPEKVRKKTGFETCDLTIPVQRSNQLSYEATDVESQSFVGSNSHNCEDHSSLDFTSAVLYTKHVIYHFSFILTGSLEPTNNRLTTSVASQLSWLERRTSIARSWVQTPLKF